MSDRAGAATIVVAGEALIDLIETPSGDLGVHPGGGPFNTARWLGRLGMQVGYLGALATDPLGRLLRDSLAEAGVSLDGVVETRLPTTLAVAQLDDAGAAHYSFYTEATSTRDLSPEQVRGRLPDALEAIYVGSFGLVLEPMASATEVTIALARQRGALVMLDPNVRSTLIDDRAHYLSRLGAALRQTDVLKLSVEDAAWLMPKQSPHAAARALLGRGPRIVLLTEGADGATVFRAGTETHLRAAPVALIDSIGAGDAFAAGFLASWLGSDPDATDAAANGAAFAIRVAGIACGVRGATPPADVAARLANAEGRAGATPR